MSTARGAALGGGAVSLCHPSAGTAAGDGAPRQNGAPALPAPLTRPQPDDRKMKGAGTADLVFLRASDSGEGVGGRQPKKLYLESLRAGRDPQAAASAGAKPWGWKPKPCFAQEQSLHPSAFLPQEDVLSRKFGSILERLWELIFREERN